jgi:hypothetical protein
MPVTLNASTITMNSGSVVQDPPGTAPSYLCRAWVNCDGSGSGFRSAGNVSSITDGGVGVYTVNFTTAMPDANYACLAHARSNVGFNFAWIFPDASLSTGNTGVFLARGGSTFGAYDPLFVSFAIFR